MANQLTIVNSILRRLREDTVATVNQTAYSTLIAQFVNDAKQDMEETGHQWSVYITEVEDTILADGTRSYDITETNDRSYLMRSKNDPELPLAIDVTSNEAGQLFDMPYADLLSIRALEDTDNTTTNPKSFSVKSDADGRGFSIELLWGSSTARTWKTYWYVPQTDLSVTTDTDAGTEIKLPRRPIELRALYYAQEERGEIMGPRLASNIWGRSQEAIASAIEVDQQVNKDFEDKVFTNAENI